MKDVKNANSESQDKNQQSKAEQEDDDDQDFYTTKVMLSSEASEEDKKDRPPVCRLTNMTMDQVLHRDSLNIHQPAASEDGIQPKKRSESNESLQGRGSEEGDNAETSAVEINCTDLGSASSTSVELYLTISQVSQPKVELFGWYQWCYGSWHDLILYSVSAVAMLVAQAWPQLATHDTWKDEHNLPEEATSDGMVERAKETESNESERAFSAEESMSLINEPEQKGSPKHVKDPRAQAHSPEANKKKGPKTRTATENQQQAHTLDLGKKKESTKSNKDPHPQSHAVDSKQKKDSKKYSSDCQLRSHAAEMGNKKEPTKSGTDYPLQTYTANLIVPKKNDIYLRMSAGSTDASRKGLSARIDVDDLVIRILSVAAPGYSLVSSVKEGELIHLCTVVRQVLLSQSSLVEVQPPIKICGDIHGQYADLLRLFNQSGFPPDVNYLFLGDYVDRGQQNLECIALFFCYKIKYPGNFFILRGNHECSPINRVYGFFEECNRRYQSTRLWLQFQDAFATLPFTGLVSGKILCMHGGLSPKLKSMDQLRFITRPIDPPNPSLHIDLLWSDPDNFTKGWASNSRGVSYVFGKDVVYEMSSVLNIDLVARAHQVVQDGYEFFANKKLVTIFSAPHYCGQFDNAAALMNVDENLICSFMILRPSRRASKLVPK